MIRLTKIQELPEFSLGEFSGSQAPTPEYLKSNPDYLRLWFSARDKQNRSHPFFYDLNIIKDTCGNYSFQVKGVVDRPQAVLGHPGTFNDHGNMISQVICGPTHSDTTTLYVGWNKGDTEARYRLSLGTNVNNSPTVSPYLDRSVWEPLGASMPYLHNKALYYMSMKGWKGGEAHYDIKSLDIHSDKGNPTITTILTGHHCYARPWIRGNQLWYCYRDFEGFRDNTKNSYKLGLLERHNDTWFPATHKLDKSQLGDNFMEAYPALVETLFGTFMFFNTSFNGAVSIARIEE